MYPTLRYLWGTRHAALVLGVAASALVWACGGRFAGDGSGGSDPQTGGTSGSTGSGGTAAAGGTTGNGGTRAAGGSSGSVGPGGASGAGGSSGSVGPGGASAAGGSVGTGAGGIGGSSAVGGTGGADHCAAPDLPCAAMSEGGCLSALDRCVPVYDDRCCPTCVSGSCGDCIRISFFECIERSASSCAPAAPPHCGWTPDWACQAIPADDCTGPGACYAKPGCVEAIVANCPQDSVCPAECHALAAGSCNCASCRRASPICPGNTVPETDGSCYTDFCIPAQSCGM